MYYWGHGKLGRCVIQLSKFLNHTLATHNQVDSFFENINYNDGKGAFTLTLFEMTITDCPEDSMSLIVHILKTHLKKLSVQHIWPSIHKLSKHSLCSLVRKYYFLTSDSIAIFANYF
jgi:hypothetical protein